MVKAIVYVSNTGFTRKYAELLSNEVGLPVYEISDHNTPLSKGNEIIFLGWIMGGSIQGLKKAKKNYSVSAICGVGMEPHKDDERVKKLGIKNKTGKTPLFYAQGGYDHSKQKGFYKFMMNMMFKMLKNPKRMSMSEEQAQSMRNMIQNGLDSVFVENITELIAWVKKSV